MGLLMGLAGALLACTATRPQTLPARFGEEVTLKVGASAAWSSDLQVRFDAVLEDSRCPTETTCIWAGQLKILLSITQATRTSTIELLEGEQRAIGEHRCAAVALLGEQPIRDVPTREAASLEARDPA